MTAPMETADRDTLAAIVGELYEAVMAADRARFDRHLTADVTVWETGLAMMHGLAELTVHRDSRPPHRLSSLEATELLVDTFGDTGVARYLLVARTMSGETSTARVTDVFSRFDRTWLLVHHHAEELTDGGAS